MISIVVAEGVKNGEISREIFYFGGARAIQGWSNMTGVEVTKAYWMNGLDPLEVQERQAELLMQGVPFEEVTKISEVMRR